MKPTIRCVLGSIAIAAMAILFAGCGSAKMDAYLDNLERTSIKLVELTKKARTGDQAALNELTVVSKEYQDLAANVRNVRRMSPAQSRRYRRIVDDFTASMAAQP